MIMEQQTNTKQLTNFYQDSENQSQQDILHTIRKNILPPNQIIAKSYQADIKAQIKLLSLQQNKNLQSNQQSNQENNGNNNAVWNLPFEQEDTLAYNYAQKLKTSLVYLKYNNKNYIKCPENKCKYISGLFIPLADLLRPEMKTYKNLYKSLNQLDGFPQVQYFKDIQNSFTNGSQYLNTLNAPQIKFSSNYQSSNLLLAIKTGNLQYDLILQNDVNSKGTTQWFNFAVSLNQPGTFKFNIINLTKSHSLFQKGMKITMFSYHSYNINSTSWTRGCSNITYTRNSLNRQGKNNENNYYSTLHFDYQNKQKTDTVVFSYGYPYSGLQMQKYFNKITHRKLSINLKIQKIKLTQTLTGLPIWVYHIYPKFNNNTSSLHNLNRSHFSLLQNKAFKSRLTNTNIHNNGIVFLARQHPGQSQSSFILQGILQFILENNQYDQNKKNYHYYIFPLVNPDGVYYGNYRTNLSGNDLNRVWKQPRKDFHSQIYYIKKYLFNVNRYTPLKLVIDLHGHSTALNSFFYGNPKKQGIFPLQNPKLFPYYCSKQMKQISFPQCTFHISQDKKNSARVVLNEMFPKALVYTLQSSFWGYKKGKKVVQFTIQKYKKLGRQLLASFFEYVKITQRVPQIKQKWQKQIQALNSSKNDKQQKCQQSEDDHSDSQVSQQLIEFQEQYQKIDNINNENGLVNKQKQLYNRDLKISYQNPLFNFSNSRLYQGRKYYLSSKNQQNKQNNIQKGFPGIILKQDMSSQFNLGINQGFLSIVKIQAKKCMLNQKSTNQKQQKDKTDIIILNQQKIKVQTVKTYNNFTFNKQKQQQQNPPTDVKPKLFVSPLQTPKKQYNVRQLKNKSIKNDREIKYINQKQFLLRKRKSRKLTYCVSDILDQKNNTSTLNLKYQGVMFKGDSIPNSTVGFEKKSYY